MLLLQMDIKNKIKKLKKNPQKFHHFMCQRQAKKLPNET